MKENLIKMYVKGRTQAGAAMFTAADVAKFIDGEIIGDSKAPVNGMSAYYFAKEEDITFAMDEGELAEAKKSKASCIITSCETEGVSKTVIRVKDMKLAMTILYNAMLEIKPAEKGTIHPTALISPQAKIGKNASVGPYTVVEEGVEIGDNFIAGANCFIGKETSIGDSCHIFSNVTIYEQTVMGNRVNIHSGTVVGSDGFGYVPKDGKIYKVPQIGNVVIGNNVEIGSNTSIDRGTFSKTTIGENTKIDNLVQIAHNVKIGKNVFIAGLVGIAGSSEVGDNTMLGGLAGIADHVKIGKNVKVGGKTGVFGNVADGMTIFGYPHREAKDARKLYGLLTILVKNSRKLRRFIRSLPAHPLEGEDK